MADTSSKKDKRGGSQAQESGGPGGNASLPDLNSIIGYMPKRGDFDHEYDADADTLLADLEFFEDDTE